MKREFQKRPGKKATVFLASLHRGPVRKKPEGDKHRPDAPESNSIFDLIDGEK